jgi:hypothetical protein
MEPFIHFDHIEKLVRDTSGHKNIDPRRKLLGLKFLREKMWNHIHSDARVLLDQQIAALEAEVFSIEHPS